MFFSVSSGPPGTAFIMKNVIVATRNSTGIVSRIRRAINCSMRCVLAVSGPLRCGACRRERCWRLQPDMLVRVVIEDRRMPPTHPRMQQVHPRVVVDGDHRHLVEKDRLGLLEQLVAGLPVAEPGRLLEQAVVFGIRPSSPVVAAIGKKRLEERRRSEEHTSELQSPCNLVCRLLLE